MRLWVLVSVVCLLFSIGLLGNTGQAFAVVNGTCTCEIAPSETGGTYAPAPVPSQDECDATLHISGKDYVQCKWAPYGESSQCLCKQLLSQQARGIEDRGSCTTRIAGNALVTSNLITPDQKVISCAWVGEDPELEQTDGQLFSAPLRSKIKGLDQFNGKDLPQVIGAMVQLGMSVLGIISLVIFIYGGIWWMLANGDSHREQQAKDTILWGCIGIVIILISYAIVTYLFESFL